MKIIEVITQGPQGPVGPQGPSGSINTSSFATTGSNTFIGDQIVTGSIVSTLGFTGSLQGTSTSASYALNGGVTSIIAGGGVVISPSNGLGNITINATAATYNTATGSYGSFYDTGSYAAASATTIYSMSLSTTDISNGVYVSGSDRTRIYFTNAGVYNIQFSAQFSNSDNNGVDVAIWVRKNDNSSANDIPDSTGICSVPAFKAGTNGQIITSWNYYIAVASGDYIQLLWHAAVANKIILETIAAQTNPVHPRTPSLILTAQRVDTFLSNTGSFSGSFTGSVLGTASTSSFLNPLNQSVIITGSTQGNVTALTISSNTASLNLNSGNFFTLQLVQGTNTFINPSNVKPGQSSILLLSTTGSATVSFPSTVKQPSGSSYTPTATTGTDILTFASLDNTNLYLVNVKNLI